MADIKELCDRVIVIHKGTKIYDGALSRLESRTGSRQKIITFIPENGSFPDDWQNPFGVASRDETGKYTLRVPSDRVVEVSQSILTRGPVADITIEDVPLEEVISDLFESR
jgi:ABC-2 type transport system ATP-binding protein